MDTIGMRGVLAAAFIVSSGLLTGMATLPASGDLAPDATAGPAAAPDGLIDRVLHRACLVSIAATRRDLRTAADRERECR